MQEKSATWNIPTPHSYKYLYGRHYPGLTRKQIRRAVIKERRRLREQEPLNREPDHDKIV